MRERYGALVMMRDKPLDAEIPERFMPSDYHEKKIAETLELLKSLKAMSPSEAEEAAHKEFEDDLQQKEDGIRKTLALEEKYRAMLSMVKAWGPPTPDHSGLKSFMVEQIEGSISFDCTDCYSEKEVVLMGGMEWRSAKINKALKSLEYHQKEHMAEIERTNGRNDWIRKLRQSL